MQQFLYTFRYFCTPHDFLRFLLDRISCSLARYSARGTSTSFAGCEARVSPVTLTGREEGRAGGRRSRQGSGQWQEGMKVSLREEAADAHGEGAGAQGAGTEQVGRVGSTRTPTGGDPVSHQPPPAASPQPSSWGGGW